MPRVILLVISVLAIASSRAGDYSGRVVGITDGDTLTLYDGTRQLKVRLAEIDTPERGQPWGTRAREALSALAFGRNVRVEQVDTDRYGRLVGRVYVGDLEVNAEMIRGGHAWVYRQYSTDASLLDVEAEARRAGRGLWGLPEAQRVPPWDWRHGGRAAPAAPDTVCTQEARQCPDGSWVARQGPNCEFAPCPADGGPATEAPSECGTKRYCREMGSCAEARHYLTVCGLSRLDGDGDGVPCEALCR